MWVCVGFVMRVLEERHCSHPVTAPVLWVKCTKAAWRSGCLPPTPATVNSVTQSSLLNGDHSHSHRLEWTFFMSRNVNFLICWNEMNTFSLAMLWYFNYVKCISYVRISAEFFCDCKKDASLCPLSGWRTPAPAVRSAHCCVTWPASSSSHLWQPSRAGCAWEEPRTTCNSKVDSRQLASSPSPSPSSPSTSYGRW